MQQETQSGGCDSRDEQTPEQPRKCIRNSTAPVSWETGSLGYSVVKNLRQQQLGSSVAAAAHNWGDVSSGNREQVGVRFFP